MLNLRRLGGVNVLSTDYLSDEQTLSRLSTLHFNALGNIGEPLEVDHFTDVWDASDSVESSETLSSSRNSLM